MAFKGSRLDALHVIPLLFMLFVIFSIWSTHLWLHLLPMLQGVDVAVRSKGAVQTVISQTLTALLAVSFARAVFVDPGSVPADSHWRSDALEASLNEVKSTNGRARWCKHCKHYKPDRAHHCRVCKSCILRMDHHCPWIANCVGFRNYKYFFLVVVYATLTSLFVVVTMSDGLFRSIAENEMDTWKRFALVFALTLAATMSVMLVVFLTFHLWLLLHGMTTIEFCETQHKLGKRFVPYNRGTIGNIQQGLGANPFLWLCPFAPIDGDGLHYLKDVETPEVTGTYTD